MFKLSFLRIRILGAVLAILQLATACGGGGVGSGGTGYLSGVVTKGPVGGATVSAYGIAGGQAGAQVGTANTDANGNFSMSIGAYAGPLMLQASGGTYTDEATGSTMIMAQGDILTVAIPSVAAGATTSGVQITPVTAMAQAIAHHMGGGMTDANIGAANTALGSYFSVSDIVHVQPMNPLAAGAGAGASPDAQNYGMTLAAMSKLAQAQGLDHSSAMATAMMNDAADGMMDGRAGGTPIQMGGMVGGMMMPPNAGTSGLGAAMDAFMNSAQNKSGVMAAALVARLNGASGQIMGVGPAMSGAIVSGTVFNGPISKANVTALALSGGRVGAPIASSATDGQGRFAMSLGAYTGPVMLQVNDATYIDEATQAITSMDSVGGMSAVLPTVAPGANVGSVWVTPVTSMAQARAAGMVGGLTDANIVAANTATGRYFSMSDVIHTQPMNPTAAGAGASASEDARNYGMTLAAMSQLAKRLNLANSSTMVGAMMSDAADGVMNGMKFSDQIPMPMGGMMDSTIMAPTAGTSGMSAAMTDFLDSATNASGLTAADMDALVQKLAHSNGHF